MKKLIRQIRSFGSQREVLVCMLPKRQKPEGTFMAPTYIMGGSDSSYARQGGIIIKLVAVVFALLGRTVEKNRENTICEFGSADILIDYRYNFFFKPEVFSIPKVQLKP